MRVANDGGSVLVSKRIVREVKDVEGVDAGGKSATTGKELVCGSKWFWWSGQSLVHYIKLSHPAFTPTFDYAMTLQQRHWADNNDWT